MTREQGFLLDLVCRYLERGADEPYVLGRQYLPSLTAMFEREAARHSDAGDRIYPVLQLVVALRQELESPQAALRLLEVIKASPTTVEVIRASTANEKMLEIAKCFAALSGTETIKTAPRHGARAPRGAVALKDMLDVGNERRPGAPRSRTAGAPAKRRAPARPAKIARRSFNLG